MDLINIFLLIVLLMLGASFAFGLIAMMYIIYLLLKDLSKM